MKPPELCRACGSRLDRALSELGWDRHPACYRDPPADDVAMHQALRVLADTFPLARRVRPTSLAESERTAAR